MGVTQSAVEPLCEGEESAADADSRSGENPVTNCARDDGRGAGNGEVLAPDPPLLLLLLVLFIPVKDSSKVHTTLIDKVSK